MPFDFKLTFRGLIAFVSNRSFVSDPAPTSAMALLPHIAECTEFSEQISPPHTACLDFTARHLSPESDLVPDVLWHSPERMDERDRRGLLNMAGVDVTLSRDDYPSPVDQLKPEAHQPSENERPTAQTEASLAWLMPLDRLNDGEGAIRADLKAPTAGLGPGKLESLERAVAARFHLHQGRLYGSVAEDPEKKEFLEFNFEACNKDIKAYVAHQVVLLMEGVESHVDLVLTGYNRATEFRLRFSPSPGDSEVEVAVRNSELDGILGLNPRSFQFHSPQYSVDSDFSLYFRLLETDRCDSPSMKVDNARLEHIETLRIISAGPCRPSSLFP